MTNYGKYVLGHFLAGVGIVAMMWGVIWGIFIKPFLLMWLVGVIICGISSNLLDK